MNFTVRERKVRRHHSLHRYSPIDVSGNMFDVHNDRKGNEPAYCSSLESLEVGKSYIIWFAAFYLEEKKKRKANKQVNKQSKEKIQLFDYVSFIFDSVSRAFNG